MYQFSSVAQSCPTLCDPMDHSTSGFPVHYQLPELAQTHVHRVGDAIQPSNALSSPSPPAFDLSQHQGLSNESVLHSRWSKYWSFSFSINSSKEYSGLNLYASAAKSLQSCPTLCNSIDSSPPGSPVPGILQARTLDWAAISFSNS